MRLFIFVATYMMLLASGSNYTMAAGVKKSVPSVQQYCCACYGGSTGMQNGSGYVFTVESRTECNDESQGGRGVGCKIFPDSACENDG